VLDAMPLVFLAAAQQRLVQLLDMVFI